VLVSMGVSSIVATISASPADPHDTIRNTANNIGVMNLVGRRII